MLLTAAYLFLLSLLFALLEIEMEGAYGWAEKLPTWYRNSGFVRFLFAGRKPLTGYHLFMNIFILAAFHLGFFIGVPWSLAAELRVLSLFILFLAVEDFLWFVFNPHYGLRNFKKEKIWWHHDCAWLFWLVPLDYATGIMLTVLLSYLSALLLGDLAALYGWLETLGVILILVFLSSLLAPLYKRWYERMRTKDERGQTKIFH
jgi:hypothetical protein